VKVLITGAGGQLGHDLLRTFAGETVLGLTRADLDVTDRAAVEAAVSAQRPDLVVHAAAFTKVDACEGEPDAAWHANAAGAWWVARACERAGAAMVYLSSDYVFDGTAGRPYTEFDVVNPQSVYGLTKEAGEQLVRESLGAHYVVRTSWVQGSHGGNFVKTMLRVGGERDELAVVDDQIGSPTFTFDLAPAIRALVLEGAPHGTYHVTNAGHCSWFDFANAIFERTGTEVTVKPTDTASWGAPAPRPAHSVLDNRKAALVGLEPLPAWQDSLHRLIAELEGRASAG
jgi:dTDP-4-dehydrorhamnose reductase